MTSSLDEPQRSFAPGSGGTRAAAPDQQSSFGMPPGTAGIGVRRESTMALSRRRLLQRAGAAAGAAAFGSAPFAVPSRVLAQDAVRLNVWKAPHNPGDQEFWNERLAAYAAENPGVTAEYRVTPWDTWQETYTSAFAGDSPPDISYIVNSFFPKFADAGALVDLSKLEGVDLAAWEPRFDPGIWALGTRGGAVYGLPFLQSGISLVWNKALFREAGLDPEVPPATWEELREFAMRLTKPDGEQWGYSIMDNTTGEMLNFVPVPIVNHGGELTNAEDTEWLATTEGHLQGLQLQVAMIQEDRTAPPLGTFVGHDVDTAFLQGRIAMQLSYASFLLPLIGDYPDFEIGIGMPPAGPVNDLSLGGVGYWMMAEKSQHKEAAWRLIEYLTGEPVMSDYANLTRLFHTRLDINPFAGDALMEAFAATQRNYMRLPALAFDYWGIFMPEVEAALNGQKSAEDALRTTAQRINERLQGG
jgi:multiple sugar transport system substrate-binding protein